MKPRSSVVSEGVLIFNNNGMVVVASPGADQIFNYNHGELTSLSIQNIFVDGMSIIEDYRQEVLARTSQYDVWKKTVAFNSAGDRFQISINLSQFPGGDESYTAAFIKETFDQVGNSKKTDKQWTALETSNRELKLQIERRKETEQKLMMFQRLYDTMIHNFPDGVIGILNKEMEYILIDGKELNEIDLPALGLNGHHVESRDPVLARETVGKIKKAFNGENVSFEVNTSNRSYSITAVPLYNAKNEIDEILCVLKNVTEKNMVESLLKEALEKEKDLGELKSRFVTMACHEFKTPLATILSSVFLLENYSGKEYDNEKLLHSNRIRRSVNNLNTILNEFLSIETQNRDDVKMVPAIIDIPEYVSEVLLELEPLKQHGQVIDYHHEGTQTRVNSDQHLLWSILTNLIGNALKYSRQNDSVQVSTMIKDDIFILKVKDNGIGIPKQEHKYIFERFHRAPNALNYEGTGLGLHIVRKNVKLLKGSISFVSEFNNGTEFSVTLPLSEKVISSMKPNLKIL